MNNCHPCIRSVLLPTYPLDTADATSAQPRPMNERMVFGRIVAS